MDEIQEKRLFKTQEIVGKHVITMEGKDLGTISRVLVNREKAQVAGLTLSGKGWFKGEKAFEFDSIQSIGGYAVIIEKSDLVMPFNNLPELEKLANEFNIYNTRIISPSGELMGNVDDFTFDAETGKIEDLLLSGGLIKNLVKGKAQLSMEGVERLGPDVIIAGHNVQDRLIKVDPGLSDNIDSWKGNIDNLKDDFENNWDKTLSKATEVSKRLGERVKDIGEEGKGKSKEVFSKTSSFLSDSKSDLVNTYEKWKEKLQSFRNRNELSTDELSALLWKKVGRDIYGNDNNLIVAKDEEVTPQILEKVQEADKMKELLLSIATRDVAEKIEYIEYEGEVR